jgi:MFS family permease
MDKETAAGSGWIDLFRGGRAPLTVALTLGIWLHAADSLLVVTTLPSAVGEIGGDAWVSWAYTLYMLASILVGASTGLLALTLGLRTAFAAAGTLFALGCAVSALAPDMGMMLVGRFVQGMGGGGQVALVFVALDRLFPNAMMPKLVALTSAVWSVSAFCGPLVGGLFANAGLWRGAYWAFALQALLFVALVLYAVPRERRDGEAGGADRPPLLRLAMLAGGVLLVSAAAADPDPLLAPAMILGAAVLLGLFLARDRIRRGNALLPPRPFTPVTAYGAGLLMALTLAAATTTLFTYGPFFLERLFGLSPLMTGYLIAAESVAWGVCAVAIANAGANAERWLIRTGPLVVAVGIAGMAAFMPGGAVWPIMPFVLMLGGGFGLMWGFAIKRVTASAPEGERERASAALPTVQQFGYAVGAAAVGILANALGFADMPDDATLRTIAFWIFAGFLPLALVACWAAWRLSGDWPELREEARAD